MDGPALPRAEQAEQVCPTISTTICDYAPVASGARDQGHAAVTRVLEVLTGFPMDDAAARLRSFGVDFAPGRAMAFTAAAEMAIPMPARGMAEAGRDSASFRTGGAPPRAAALASEARALPEAAAGRLEVAAGALPDGCASGTGGSGAAATGSARAVPVPPLVQQDMECARQPLPGRLFRGTDAPRAGRLMLGLEADGERRAKLLSHEGRGNGTLWLAIPHQRWSKPARRSGRWPPCRRMGAELAPPGATRRLQRASAVDDAGEATRDCGEPVGRRAAHVLASPRAHAGAVRGLEDELRAAGAVVDIERWDTEVCQVRADGSVCEAVMDFVVGFPSTAQPWWLDVNVQTPFRSSLPAASWVARAEATAAGDRAKAARCGDAVRRRARSRSAPARWSCFRCADATLAALGHNGLARSLGCLLARRQAPGGPMGNALSGFADASAPRVKKAKSRLMKLGSKAWWLGGHIMWTAATASIVLVVPVFFMYEKECQLYEQMAQMQTAQMNDADVALSSELEDDHAARVAAFEGALRSMYAALPKNEHGNLEHQAVRYVLHRLFVQRHGWYIKGLDPNGPAPSPNGTTDNVSQDWLPAYLQARLEARSGGRGAVLHELAALAAALEDLVQKEAVDRLRLAYKVLQLDPEGGIERKQAEDVMFTAFLSFLVANKFSAETPEEVHKKQQIFASKYKDWDAAKDWFAANIMESSASPDGRYDIRTTSRMAVTMGEKYHELNDLECKSLKSTMLELEDRKAGRVQLSAFYNRSMHSHWRFTEKAEYLRRIGALDETNATKPMVIVPNYVMGRMNCLESSGIYSLCCRNECEDLMGRLEQEIGSPNAPADRVMQLVAGLASDTVLAPRTLPDELRSRLVDVAASNGGLVPLHSRLFAQWMHHAYPRECPYPHEPGTAGAQTPDEWMQETGQASNLASAEEMQEHIESCPVDPGGSAELPWSTVDAHFASLGPASPAASTQTAGPAVAAAEAASAAAGRPAAASGAGRGSGRLWALAVAAAAAAACAHSVGLRGQELGGPHRGSSLRGVLDGVSEEEARWAWAAKRARPALLLVACVLLLVALELLDFTALAAAAVAGLLALGVRAALASPPWGPSGKRCAV
ncbi:unnamed protein product [Prorocentrum cordatum]|uniref:Uncharacterized protein n=1 Tax=Prorocentrum cordatum TaxID=2364126 RepID=A0ABN9XW69_9DINO|nr:unnamed protein product [Polarella glacialis]